MSKTSQVFSTLHEVWRTLDEADGHLYNAAEELESMDNKVAQSEELDKVYELVGKIDISAVTNLKNAVEEAIQKMGGQV